MYPAPHAPVAHNTNVSFLFVRPAPTFVGGAKSLCLPFSCFNLQTLLLPFGVRACWSMCRQLFVASRMYLCCWRSTIHALTFYTLRAVIATISRGKHNYYYTRAV